MKRTARNFGRWAGLGLAVAVLGSCGPDEELAEELETAREQIDMLRRDVEYERERAAGREEKLVEAQAETRELETELRQLQRDLRKAESELERYRRDEERERQAEEAEPSDEEKTARSRETVESYLAARVGIEGDENSGPGLVVEAGGRHWIYLVPSILSGNTELEIRAADGAKLENFGDFELAADSSIARLELKDYEGPAVALGEAPDATSRAGVLAFDESGAVVEGRSYGERDGVLRVNREVSACPPGAPVFDAETAALLGFVVAAEAGEPSLWPDRVARGGAARDARPVPRAGWSALPIGSFLQEAKLLEKANRLTRVIEAVAALNPGSGGLDIGRRIGGDLTIKEVLSTEPALARGVADLDEWLTEFGDRASEADRNRRIEGVFDDAMRIADRQSEALGRTEFSPYHAAAAGKARAWREEAVAKLKRRIAGLK